MDSSESTYVAKSEPISLLKLYRIQSNNIYPFLTSTELTTLDKTPLGNEIIELAQSLKVCAEFYSTLFDPALANTEPIGKIEKVTQRLEELLNKQNNNSKRSRCIFFESSGAQNLVQCTKCLAQFAMRKDVQSIAKPTTMIRLKSLLGLMDILYTGDIKLPNELSFDDEFIQLLFPLFEFEEIFEHVLHCVEDLLIGRESVFPLQKIKDFYRYCVLKPRIT